MLRLILAPVFALAGLLLLSPSFAQDLFYYNNGKKIPLTKMKGHYIGKSSTDAPKTALNALFKATDTSLVTYPQKIFWLDKDTVDISQTSLSKNNIEYFGNVFQDWNGATFAIVPRICVQLKAGSTLQEVLAKFPKELSFAKDLGYNTYVVACNVQTPEEVLKLSNSLNEENLVAWSEPEFYSNHKPLLIPTDPLFNTQFYLRNFGQMGKIAGIDINIERGWDITTGSAIRVAVLDMGVEAHEDLAGRVVSGYTAGVVGGNGAPQNGNFALNGDKNHGMAVAGIIGASHNNGLGIAGIAPNSIIVPVNIFPLAGTTTNPGGAASNIDIGIAIDWAWDQGAADVLSNSWGGGAVSYMIDAAILRARTQGRGVKGCPVVFASGNANSGGVFYPAYLNFVITVGAINPGAVGSPRFWYSRPGPSMDLVAPSGEVNWAGDVVTLDRMNAAGTVAGNYINNFGGTSAACPQVAGVAALMLSMNPNLTEVDVRTILQTTATDMGPAGFDEDFGFGRLDGCRAIMQSLSNAQLVGQNSFCLNQTYSFTNVGSASLTWSVTGPATIVGSNQANPVSLATTGSGTVVLTATINAGCGIRTFTKSIAVGTPTPIIGISGIAPYPNTQMDVAVTTSAPAPYKWYVDNILVHTAYSSHATINGGGCGFHTLKVEVTSACGTSSATTQYNRSCPRFIVSPNPAESQITVSAQDQNLRTGKPGTESTNLINKVQLIDQKGTVLKTWNFSKAQTATNLDVASIRPGTYFLKIESAFGSEVITFVKR